MKKFAVLIIALLVGLTFTNIPLAAQDGENDPCQLNKFSLSVGAGMRGFSEERFKDVYGSSGMAINVDFGVRVTNSLEAFLHTDYFSVDGELTYTKEETTLKIIPVELGIRYLLKVNKDCKPKLFPYIGAGAGYYMYKEENFIGTIDEKKFGFFVEGGFRYYMGSLFFDAKIKNIFLNVENDLGESIQLGGLAFMGAVGISF
ncbi:MAG: porin family protein [bacterium]|nr:porin family protein [bacterium]